MELLRSASPSKFDEKLEVPGANEGEGGVSENTDTRADEKPTVSADSNSQTISGKEQKETGKTDADKQLDDFVLTSGRTRKHRSFVLTRLTPNIFIKKMGKRKKLLAHSYSAYGAN